jgi:hypothetical protein
VTSDGYSKTVNNTYTNDTTNWLLGRLTASSVTSQAPTQLGKICSLPWGATIGDGQRVMAYSAAQPAVGQDCSAVAQTRTCSNGTLSGSYALQTCAALCALPWGGTISQGQSVTAYSVSVVSPPQVCASVAQTRTCGASGVLNGSYANQSCVVRQPKTIYLTSGTSWAVPADWNNAINKIEVIGGGGGGNGGGGSGNGGGGVGGGYSSVTNLTLTPGSTVSYNVGLGGATPGGDTWFNGGSRSNASVSAQGGGVGWLMNGGLGGQAANGIGTTRYSGGSGGQGSYGGAGGGGAAGPHGNGGVGGNYAGGEGGGGGGGADGGTSGGNAVGPVSGAGGSGWQGNGAWSGNCASGTSGTGAGGSGGYGGGYGDPNGIDHGSYTASYVGCGGNGSMDAAFDASHGSGGGGGGGGSHALANYSYGLDGYPGGAGASFGGGGGGGGAANASSGQGGQGIIVITYTPSF